METIMRSCVRMLLGAVHKVRYARVVEWVREVLTVCDRGRGKEHVTSHLYIFLSYI